MYGSGYRRMFRQRMLHEEGGGCCGGRHGYRHAYEAEAVRDPRQLHGQVTRPYGHGPAHCCEPIHGHGHARGPRIEGFWVPCLLLLLREKPAHGYELMEKLALLPFVDVLPDPGVVYRHLRRLEEEGMVAAQLEPGSGGPARKVYSLTPEGESFLSAWAVSIRRRKETLEGFLEAYDKGQTQTSGGSQPDSE